jgi:hypothetical protein
LTGLEVWLREPLMGSGVGSHNNNISFQAAKGNDPGSIDVSSSPAETEVPYFRDKVPYGG